MKKILQTVESIRKKTDFVPDFGLVLGSGLGALADQIDNAVSVPFEEIENFPQPTVSGHSGSLVFGTIGDTKVAALKGRIHLYEGHSPEDIVLPVRVLKFLGITKLMLTNAAGGINPGFKPGDLMIITDHLNLQGKNPLTGPNDDTLGPRFLDLTEAYNKELIELIEKCAEEENIKIKKGVYAGLPGPTYETPAEVRMLKTLGADAVGMSTVAENIAANHLGVKVCGISLISNMAAGISKTKLTHEEVKETAAKAEEYFVRLIKSVLKNLKLIRINYINN